VLHSEGGLLVEVLGELILEVADVLVAGLHQHLVVVRTLAVRLLQVCLDFPLVLLGELSEVLILVHPYGPLTRWRVKFQTHLPLLQ